MTISPGVRFVQDRDGGILLDIEADQFFSLNPTGAFIWEYLSRGCTQSEIAEALVKTTGFDLSVLLPDVDSFLSELQVRGLILSFDAVCEQDPQRVQ
jgi:hypothetical protein